MNIKVKSLIHASAQQSSSVAEYSGLFSACCNKPEALKPIHCIHCVWCKQTSAQNATVSLAGILELKVQRTIPRKTKIYFFAS